MPPVHIEAEEKITQAAEPIGEVGMKVSTAIHNAVLAGGEPVRSAVDVLHGKWLGHPLHPVLTDVTVGAWTMGMIFDLAGAVTGNRQVQQAADQINLVGTLSAVPTALTGLADYSTFPEWSATPATIHGAANVVAVGLYTWSLTDRVRGHRTRGIVTSMLAYAISGFSAWLGGELVYKHQVGVNHRDRFEGPEQWTAVMDATDLPQRKGKRVEVEGSPVLVYRDGESVYAIGAKCSHAGGPLNEGEIKNGCVQCPWHDSVFDLRDGHIVHGPATYPQAAFAARERNGQIELRIIRPTEKS